jgi:hypothetical protein
MQCAGLLLKLCFPAPCLRFVLGFARESRLRGPKELLFGSKKVVLRAKRVLLRLAHDCLTGSSRIFVETR